MQFRGWMLLGAVSLVFAVPAKAGIPYAIVLTKTVGVAPGCATTDDITVDAGTVVHYCYQVKNTGYMTLNVHTLTDDVLGTLVGPNQLQDLAPGQIRTEVFSSSVNATVTNTATWTAMSSTVYYGTSQAVTTATSMDAATVNVLEMGDGACSDGIDNDGDTIVDCADPDCADAAVCRAQAPAIGTTGLLVAAVLLLVIGNLALVSRRRRV